MALVNCCEADRTVVDEEMGVLQQDYEKYKTDVAGCKTSLDVGLVKWDEYQEQFTKCSEWLSETETLVQSFMKLQTGILHKKSQLEQFQQHLQTIFDWQNELDRLNVKAQLLLDICSDSRISNAVTQMSTKYNALLSLSKEVMRRLEQHYQEHQQQQSILSELTEWLESANNKLTSCSKVANSIKDIKNRIENTRTLKNSLEHEQNKLRYLLELKEKVILNTDPEGIWSINEDIDNLQADFDKLLNAIAGTRAMLTNKLTDLEEYTKTHEGFIQWLNDVEASVNKESGKIPDDLIDKVSLLEKYRTLQRDIVAHKDLAEKLRSKFEDEKPTDVTESLEKYEDLGKVVKDCINDMEGQVKIHEQYKDALKVTTELLNKIKQMIKQCGDCTVDQSKLKQNFEILDKMKKEDFKNVETHIQKTTELCEKVKEASDQSITKGHLAHIAADWEIVQTLLKKVEKNLKDCLACWEDYQTIYQSLSGWMLQFEHDAKGVFEKDSRKLTDLNDYKKLVEELESHKSNFDELNGCSEQVCDLSGNLQVRDQTVDLFTTYNNHESKLNVS